MSRLSEALAGGSRGGARTQSLGIGLRVKRLFFDTDRVKRALDATTRKTFGRFGAAVRGIARRSLIFRKNPKLHSKPGDPPRSHGQQQLKRFIFFSLEEHRRTVVIGPEKLSGSAAIVPRLLEEGGFTRARRGRRRKRIRARVATRPYMGPAKEVGIAKLPTMWDRSIKA